MSLITAENKTIALWTKKYALELGCQATRVTLVAGTNNSFEYRDKQLDKLESSTESSIRIELFVDHKYGSFSSNRLDKEELKSFIAKGINSVKHLAEDKYRVLPDSDRYYKEDGTYLDLYDPLFYSLATDKKLEVAQKAIDEIYNTHKDIISISSSYEDSISSVYMVSSNGFEAETNRTSYSLMASVTLRTESDARAESYWYDFATHWNELQKEGIGKIALDKALQKVGQEKIISGKYTMLLDNMTSSRLLSPVVGALSGGAIQQRNSFLIDKLEQKLFSDKVTLIDRPHQKRVIGSRLYDGEGIATQDRTIIENGVLKTYYIDTYNSLKLDMTPTIASSTGLCLKFGEKNHEQLIQSIDRGIWVTGFNGGNTNANTGDFSFGIDGFLIENGKVIKPISEMNITGNLLTLWANVAAIGNNPRRNTATQIPSIVFNDVSFSGL